MDHAQKLICKGRDKPTMTRVKLINGSSIWCLPVGLSGQNIRGMTCHRIYIDEAGRVPSEIITEVVEPMLTTTGGNLILLGTPAGPIGFFADVALNKEGKYERFTRFFLDTETVLTNRPINEGSWTEEQRFKMLEHIKTAREHCTNLQWEQEYMGHIVDKLHQFFSSELIKSCMVISRETKCVLSDTSPPITASLTVKPVPAGDTDNFLGIDIARYGEDEEVFLAVKRYNKEFIEQIDMEIRSKISVPETVRRIKVLNNRWQFKKIYIDTGGVGGGVYDIALETDGLRHKVVSIDNASKTISLDSKQHRRLLKEDLYDNLKRLMEQGKVKLFNDMDIYNSLASVQFEYKSEDSTQIRIFGQNTHICEALIRAAWCMQDKSLSLWAR